MQSYPYNLTHHCDSSCVSAVVAQATDPSWMHSKSLPRLTLQPTLRSPLQLANSQMALAMARQQMVTMRMGMDTLRMGIHTVAKVHPWKTTATKLWHQIRLHMGKMAIARMVLLAPKAQR